MSIDEDNLSSPVFFSNTLNVYKKFSFSNSNAEKSLLIDFNGAFSSKTE
jgi:hypothetical protein